MDALTAALIAVAIFALILLAAFPRFKKVKTGIKGAGVTFDLEGSEGDAAPSPGVRLADARSHAGAVVAEDPTGRGADVRRVEAHDGVRVTSAPPPANPKGQPPA